MAIVFRFCFVVSALAALPALAPALDLTCTKCLSMCCSWAYSGRDSPYDAYVRRTDADPTPCVEVTAKYGYGSGKASRCRSKAYYGCIRQNCSRCAYGDKLFWVPGLPLIMGLTKVPGHWGVSGNPPIRFEPGQSIEIQRGMEKEASPASGGADNAASMRAVRQNDEIAWSPPTRANRK